MRLEDIPRAELRARFRGPGVRLSIAGLSVNVWTDLPGMADEIARMYVGHRIEAGPGIDDFRIHLRFSGALRRFVRRQTQIYIDGRAVFAPLPYRLAYLSVEASLNWCIGRATPSHLVLHAAVVERDGVAVILPAPPASGKSTLCAALVTRGWRLLSDELGVLRPEDGRLRPAPRPISLKNASIPLLRAWAPGGHFSPVFTGTSRGDIAFLRPPAPSVARAEDTAVPALVVSPAYRAGAPARLEELGKPEAFRMLLANSFNYDATQRAGFDAMTRLVETCGLYRLSYGTLDQAMATLERLLARSQVRPDAPRLAVRAG